jgi:hypothetical protein
MFESLRKAKPGAIPEKHIPFFRLLRALARDECPICCIAREAVAGYFGNLLYENVNDKGFRERFDRDRGLCNKHSYELAGLNDGLAVGIIYRKLLETAGDALANGRRSERHSGSCVVCDCEREAELQAIAVLADFLEDDELREAFAASSGLCVPHLSMLEDRVWPLPDWFVELHKEKYSRLLECLDLYLDSCSFSLTERKPALSREEQLVWREAIARIAGYSGMSYR